MLLATLLVAPFAAFAQVDVSQIRPRLQVDIPGVSISKPILTAGEGAETGTVDVPFIADYIDGVFRYATGIAAVLATFMIMVGGMQYLVAGGDRSKVSAAQDRIRNAVIGLILALGAFTILSTVSRELVALKNISLLMVKRDPFETALQTVTVNTTENIEGPAAPAGTGGFTEQFPDCPLQLTSPMRGGNPNDETRSQEFAAQIGNVVTATDTRERILAIAEAAEKCGVALGSCGRTVGAVLTMAGVGSCATLFQGDGCYVRGRKIHDTPAGLRETIGEYRCPETGGDRTVCKTSSKDATAAAFAYLKPQMESGWPDSWATQLEPGDVIVVYNGNSARGSAPGLHSMIFVGWAANGKAQVIQGNYQKATSDGAVCITSNCTPTVPLIRVFKP